MSLTILQSNNSMWPELNLFNSANLKYYLAKDFNQRNFMFFQAIFESKSKSIHLFVGMFLCLPYCLEPILTG
jgi:hypothetical protein